MPTKNFEERLRGYADEFHPVVPFDDTDRLLLLDFTESNKELTAEILENTHLFIQYINLKLQAAGAKYGIGGYGEHRTIYSRSQLFGPSPTTIPQVQDDAEALPGGKGRKILQWQRRKPWGTDMPIHWSMDY